jgi:glycine cleavage system aminomethyltransferase T/glycine/D-amino acid oxidase-like deaminating enzyme
MANQQEHAKVVVIGGGVIGLSTAYHLGRLGCRDVLLLERNELTSGTSWHAAGIVGPLRSSMNLTKLAIYATELFPALEAETGQATGYRRTGGLWLARTPDRLVELKRIAAMGEMAGLDASIVSAAECANRFSLLHVDDLSGALWVSEDGQTNPVDTCMAYAKGARTFGVRIRERTSVTAINAVAGAVHSVETADGGVIRCDFVVNCGGVWARQIGAMAGVPVPVQAVQHMYVVTEPVDGLPAPCPIVRDLDGGIYIKEDAGKIVIGGFEHNAKLWHPAADHSDPGYLIFPEDWEQFEPFLNAGMHRLPKLQATGIRHFMNGPEAFTPDTRQIMGEAPGLRNFFVAAGFNSIGIVSSAGVGRAISEWIVDGKPSMDLWDVDIARMDESTSTTAFLAQRIPEAVADQFDIHWPYKQPRTGRDVRRSSLHHALANKGAVFGAPAGWERPLWFAESDAEREICYSYGRQRWWSCAEREARAMADRVGLLELSPFTKIEVSGADAQRLLQRVCAGDVDCSIGTLVYTQMLNHRGGIEADVTVTRVADDQYWIFSGAPTRTKDLAWLRRAVDRTERAAIADITAAYAVIGLMGPLARELLQRISGADLSTAAFAFATSHLIEVGAAPVRASRVSYVGELGWELYVPVEYAEHVHRTICAVGAEVGLAHVGHFCVDACRIEKGYRHWGHDIGPEDSPLEAGLAFAVSFQKETDFVGRTAVIAQQARGLSRHLLLFSVEDASPLLLHDEPVYSNGRLVGRTTSGARGFRTGLSLCFAYIGCPAGTPKGDLFDAAYEIGVAGERHRLRALRSIPYDPKGERMRR